MGRCLVLYVAGQVPPIMSILKIGSAQSLNREDAAFVSHGSPQVPVFLGKWGGHLHLLIGYIKGGTNLSHVHDRRQFCDLEVGFDLEVTWIQVLGSRVLASSWISNR